ncbi:MAG: class I SAM-dependent methyltransferase [Gemmatimonadota bacterium]
MLDLVRLSPRNVFPPGGVELYRHIALLTDLSPGDELLEVACGVGMPLIYWVKEYGVQGSGVDSDPGAVARAERRIKEEGMVERVQVQEGSAADLPYRDEIFDVVVGEMGLTADSDPEAAIRELVRVTRPGGAIALVQLVWKAPVDPRRRKILSSHLGARPLMLVELKRILRESGVRDLHTEDWSDEETAFRSQVTKPFPDFAELFSVSEKLGILRRAWRRWGWTGVKTAVLREREVHQLLTRERIIALDLVLGTKEGAESEAGAEVAPGEETADLEDADAGDVREERGDEKDGGAAEEAGHEETVGLPLFGGAEESSEQ